MVGDVLCGGRNYRGQPGRQRPAYNDSGRRGSGADSCRSLLEPDDRIDGDTFARPLSPMQRSVFPRAKSRSPAAWTSRSLGEALRQLWAELPRSGEFAGLVRLRAELSPRSRVIG